MPIPSKAKLALTSVLVLAALAYGIVAGRCRIFPYSLVDGLFSGTDDAPEPPRGSTPRQPPRQRPAPQPRQPLTNGFAAEGPAHPPRPQSAMPTGWWKHVPRNQTRPSAEQTEGLAVVPYLQGTQPAGEAANVTVHDTTSAYAGVNLVISGHAPEALLIDMDGNVLHSWRRPFASVWPGKLRFFEAQVNTTYWRRAHLFPNGDLLAIYDGIGMVKLDSESNVIWKYRERPHHDLDIGPDGEIYTLLRQVTFKPQPAWIGRKIVEDFVAVLSPDGKERKRVSVLRAIVNSKYQSVLARRPQYSDILHSNTIELLDGRHAHKYPMLKKGRLLISVRNLDMVAVMDIDKEEITWAMTDLWRWQHQPTVVPSGNILLFDNRGNSGKSRVLEFDPLTHDVVWSYTGTPDAPLHSAALGSCQRLPNGNTLITESEPGRAIEVLPDRSIVWEYMSPFRAGPNQELVASLFDVVRLAPDYARFAFNQGNVRKPSK